MFDILRRKKRYRCTVCGGEHNDLPAVASIAPAQYDWASDDERASDFVLTSDTCVWNDKHFFIRCVLDIPYSDREGALGFGVWSTLSEANYRSYIDAWGQPHRSEVGTMFGWFSNQLPGFPDTLNLACHVIPRASGLRPLIELEPSDHPLAIQQRTGIPYQSAADYAHLYLGI